MKYFLGIDINEIDKDYKNTFISLDKIYTYNEYLSTLYFCYSNNTTCYIGSSSDKNTKFKGILFNNKNRIFFIDWSYLNDMNIFFSKKFKIKETFYIKNNLFYNIFFLKLIHTNSNLYTNSGINLVGRYNSFFGILDSFNNSVETNNKHLLYFSYSISRFILYRVQQNNQFIYGKLMKNCNINDNILTVDKRTYDIPKSFKHISKNVYAIKKKNIIIKLTETCKKNVIKHNDNFDKFCKLYQSENMIYLKFKNYITKDVLLKLYKFLIAKYPILYNKNNYVLLNPENFHNIKTVFSLYLLNTHDNQELVIHYNQYLNQYIQYVIPSIDEFFSTLSSTNVISTKTYSFSYNTMDKRLHLLSEIYYIIMVILLKLPKIINNISYSKKNDVCEKYIHANFEFSKKEIKKLIIEEDNYIEYIIRILIKSISIFMNGYFLFINNMNNIDIIPIFHGMDNIDICKILKKSKYSNYSKSFLIAYLSELFINLNNSSNKNMEIPIIFLNITKINTDSNIKIKKIQSQTLNNNIPIIINILYNKKQLIISLTYKKKYEKIKYLFSEIINQVL